VVTVQITTMLISIMVLTTSSAVVTYTNHYHCSRPALAMACKQVSYSAWKTGPPRTAAITSMATREYVCNVPVPRA
jgi:hypothetical protein